jgi:hypothetical protein
MLVIQNTKATTRPIVDTTSNKAVLEPWGTLSFAGDWRPIHLDAFWQRLQLQVRHSVGCGLDLLLICGAPAQAARLHTGQNNQQDYCNCVDSLHYDSPTDDLIRITGGLDVLRLPGEAPAFCAARG